jgi:drug/metabolite transporter superfamily protein YnfA
MNPRITTSVIGVLTTVMGMLALIYPKMVMQQVTGYAVDPGFSANFVLGEVRAAYGGVFTVIGIYTILAAMDPYPHDRAHLGRHVPRTGLRRRDRGIAGLVGLALGPLRGGGRRDARRRVADDA